MSASYLFYIVSASKYIREYQYILVSASYLFSIVSTSKYIREYQYTRAFIVSASKLNHLACSSEIILFQRQYLVLSQYNHLQIIIFLNQKQSSILTMKPHDKENETYNFQRFLYLIKKGHGTNKELIMLDNKQKTIEVSLETMILIQLTIHLMKLTQTIIKISTDHMLFKKEVKLRVSFPYFNHNNSSFN